MSPLSTSFASTPSSTAPAQPALILPEAGPRADWFWEAGIRHDVFKKEAHAGFHLAHGLLCRIRKCGQVVPVLEAAFDRHSVHNALVVARNHHRRFAILRVTPGLRALIKRKAKNGTELRFKDIKPFLYAFLSTSTRALIVSSREYACLQKISGGATLCTPLRLETYVDILSIEQVCGALGSLCT